MLQTNSFDNKNVLGFTLDNLTTHDAPLRQKLHRLLSQNFELKQLITKIEHTLHNIEEEKHSLKQQLRIAIDQINNNDKLISNYKNADIESQAAIKQLQLTILNLERKLETQKQVVSSLLQHNRNLQTENKLLAQIKQKYNSDFLKSKIEIDYLKRQNQKLQQNNSILSTQIDTLNRNIQSMQQQISSHRQQLQDYESFVLQKVSEAKESPQLHQFCHEQYDKLYFKYIKYKQKSHHYKHDCTRLRFHLEQISKQMDSSSLRKYFTTDQHY